MLVYRDGSIEPPKGADKLSISERIDYCLATISALSYIVGDDSLHSALQMCMYVRVPHLNLESKLWTD